MFEKILKELLDKDSKSSVKETLSKSKRELEKLEKEVDNLLPKCEGVTLNGVPLDSTGVGYMIRMLDRDLEAYKNQELLKYKLEKMETHQLELLFNHLENTVDEDEVIEDARQLLKFIQRKEELYEYYITVKWDAAINLRENVFTALKYKGEYFDGTSEQAGKVDSETDKVSESRSTD